MERPEEISGSSLMNLIERLRNDKIVLSLYISNVEYEGLSIILGTKIINRKECMMLDFPAGMEELRSHTHGLPVSIEFTDKNKINYYLKSIIEFLGWRIQKNDNRT